MRQPRPSRTLALSLPAAAVLAAACADPTRAPTIAADPAEARSAAPGAVLPTAKAAPAANARFARLHAVDVPVPPRAAAAMLAVGAAPGTLVREIVGANPSGCGLQTGIAFDGTNLMMSCWTNQILDVMRTSDGSLVKRLSIPSLPGGIFALAWDGRRNRLWACVNYRQVYLIDTSDPDGNGVVEAGEVQFGFTATDQCVDGLAYDGEDQTLWTSGDVHSNVYHYKTDGTELGRHYIVNILGTGNSGIAVGGGNMYLANNGRSQIYETNKPPTTGTLFATFPRRIEDLECDDITFRRDGISVIWQQDAYDRQIQAYAIEPNACPFGGFAVPQAVMDVQPSRISVAGNAVTNVVLISNALFDARTVNLANVRFVVNGNAAAGAPVARRGASYNTAVADYNRDGLPDRLVSFTMASLRAAGLTAGATNVRVQDVASASGQFEASDTVLPTFVP